MEHDRIEFYLKTSPSIKVLRSQNAPLITSFLYRHFPGSNKITIPQSELVEKLDDYLEVLREEQPELYPETAQTYLDIWCNNEHQFLKKYYSTNDDPVFELTQETNRAIAWLEENLNRREFVGTESQFLEIFTLLSEIVTKSTEDPSVRLEQLEKQKAEIQKEIDAIEKTGEVAQYSFAKLKEWFIKATQGARRLLVDFGEVEQNFKDITRKVQEAQLKEGALKGLVVAEVIDADAELRKSEQGRSFYAFRDFMMTISLQEELQTLIDKVYGLPDLQEVTQKNPILRGIKRSLIKASDRIVQSNYRLAEQLRKMLDSQHLAENRRVTELITDIKKLALAAIDNPPTGENFIWIEGYPEIQLVMEKPLWQPTVEHSFNRYSLSAGNLDLSSESLEVMYNQFYVDEEELKRRIAKMLKRQNQVTLVEVTEEYPVEKGLAEVIAYVALASRDEKHRIDESVREGITLSSFSDKENVMRLTMPQVVFRR